MRSSYLVCYDICDDKRLKKVFKAMRGFGDHLQYSVFECQFTAADVVIGSGLRFGMMFKVLPERAELTAYTGRLAQRPALQRTGAKDKELAAT